MTAAQRLWFGINIQKDRLESAEQFLKLCQHIRPDVYFKEEPTSVSTNIFADIEEKLGRPLTEQEKADLQEHGLTTQEVISQPPRDVEEILNEDIDIIERV